MTDYAAQLHAELENLRQDRDFMFKCMTNPTLCHHMEMGSYTGEGWKVHTQKPKSFRAKTPYVILSAEEVFRAADMRQLLLGLFWMLQARSPYKKGAMDTVGDDAFWLEFLRLAKDAQWQRRQLHQAILASESPQLPNKVKVASWFYFLTHSRTPGDNGTPLPPQAFERLEHVAFAPEQKERWEMLPDFGLESLFKKQLYRTNVAIDMSSLELPDWFSFALVKYRPDIVCHWLKEYPAEQLNMSLRDVLLFVVANYRGDGAVKIINALEELSPGLCAAFRDRHGNNLLWYTAVCWQLRSPFATPFAADGTRRDPASAPGDADDAWKRLAARHGDPNGRNASNRKLLQRLFGLGISPDQPNRYGFSFRDLDDFGRMLCRRWQITRIQQDAPDFDDAHYWRPTARRRARTA
ncbi:MAG: hypothetical protein GX945_14025 [Lentisphaerae bacterium]|nr:hypothetical protein [Lentisphaerota bacterium]